MRYAIIESNKVINIAKSIEPLASNWVLSDSAAIGDTFENGEFIKAPEPPIPVPATVSKRQAKQQLLTVGLLSQVQIAIDSIEDPTERQLVQIFWDDSQEYERNHPTLTALATGFLGLTDEMLDDLFRAASLL